MRERRAENGLHSGSRSHKCRKGRERQQVQGSLSNLTTIMYLSEVFSFLRDEVAARGCVRPPPEPTPRSTQGL
eukprot:COSAG04_NODE_273_length_18488_cov_69.506281_10_plen_73_part_00